MDGPHPGGLGGTYSGNPLACAAAVEAIKMISDPAFLNRALAVGDRMRQHLLDMQAEMPLIGDVRGIGPMLLMELVADRDTKAPAAQETLQVTLEALQRGVICIRAGLLSNCIRFLPPLNIPDDQLDEGLGVVAEAVRAVEISRQAVAQ
jgi:4-aminobutyrate aminotransferase/(S)-3-amino-2-methylpropionate transaminase